MFYVCYIFLYQELFLFNFFLRLDTWSKAMILNPVIFLFKGFDEMLCPSHFFPDSEVRAQWVPGRDFLIHTTVTYHDNFRRG